jgi:hypothetical protein
MKKIITTITKAISRTALFLLAQSFNGVGFATIIAVTNPQQRKSPFGTITKKSRMLVNWGNWSYSNALESQAKREGKEIDFEVQPRRWGTRLQNSPLVHHVNKQGEEKHYLEVKVENVFETEYFEKETGKPLTYHEVSWYLYEKKESATQDKLEKKIYLRDFSLDSIVSIVHGGVEYVVS